MAADGSSNLLGDTLRWTLESVHDPAMAAADWLARDIDPTREGAVNLLTDPSTALASLVQAKDAFKTMRIVGETPADRAIGGRLYAATIAAALLHHGQRISRQSDEALRRGLRQLGDDDDAHPDLRRLAQAAMERLPPSPHRAG